MPKYRRKPIVVEAVKISSPITIVTDEGTLNGNTGDYLITQADGAQFPCTAETFEKTYEPVKTHVDVKKFIYKVLRRIKYILKTSS